MAILMRRTLVVMTAPILRRARRMEPQDALAKRVCWRPMRRKAQSRITGLYARRHEAELRLRAAEQNLARVQDVLVALEEQHKGLKRQARQASRYRNLS